MKLIYKIIFFTIEFISGYGFAILLTNNSDFLLFDMFLSFILGFILICSAAIIGIIVPGYFYHKFFNKNTSFLNAVILSIAGIFIGFFIIFIIDNLDSNEKIINIGIFQDYRIMLPILISVVGFNIGLTKKTISNTIYKPGTILNIGIQPMEIAKFNVRCYVCWKQFPIPALSDFSFGEFLFVNYKTREFRYFYRIDNTEVESIINKKLKSDSKLEQRNEKVNENISLKLIGKLSDGNFEPVFSHIKCPRCNFGFHSFPNKKIGMINIAELTFEDSKNKTLIKSIEQLELGIKNVWQHRV